MLGPARRRRRTERLRPDRRAGHPAGRRPGRHPDDDVQAARYERADAVLTAAGYRWEEVSNWALPGHGCRHNQLYWRQGDYRGIGSAAHSHRHGRRWWNVRTPERYVAAVVGAAGRRWPARRSSTAEQRRFEAWRLSLRTPAGVPVPPCPTSPSWTGLVDRAADRAVLTVRGRLLANEVTVRLANGGGEASRHGTSR